MIKFHFPVHWMNMAATATEGTEAVSIGIKIGERKLWSALHNIDLVTGTPTVSAPNNPTFVRQADKNNLVHWPTS